jgi:hypothetical protein
MILLLFSAQCFSFPRLSLCVPEMPLSSFTRLDLDIDRYINPFLPRSRVHQLPKPISRFLGHRDEPRQNIGNIITWAYSFIGAFCGIALIAGVFGSSATIRSHAPPVIVGSFVSSPSDMR